MQFIVEATVFAYNSLSFCGMYNFLLGALALIHIVPSAEVVVYPVTWSSEGLANYSDA